MSDTSNDYGAARVYLAKWAAHVAAHSEQSAPPEMRYRNVGIWGHDGWQENSSVGAFQILNVSEHYACSSSTSNQLLSALSTR